MAKEENASFEAKAPCPKEVSRAQRQAEDGRRGIEDEMTKIDDCNNKNSIKIKSNQNDEAASFKEKQSTKIIHHHRSSFLFYP